jgi:hypothetical protein
LAQDLIITVQAADEPSGPWTDLARSTNGDRFDLLLPDVSLDEQISGGVSTVRVSDFVDIHDPQHPTRFLRLKITRN